MKKSLLALFLFSFSVCVLGSDEVVEAKSLVQISDSLRFEKKQVETIVDTMVRSGRISADEGSRAKREIASVKEDDFEELKIETMKRLRASNVANN
jgi:polyhydroxyalkanoate synthesis regulator phasin